MKKWVLIAILAVLVVISYSVYIYKETMGGKLQGEAKALIVAKEKKNLKKVTNVDYYNGMTSYKVVQGADNKGVQWIVWVPSKRGKVLSSKKTDGISSEEAIRILREDNRPFMQDKQPKQIIKVKLGAENDVPLWEITYIDHDNRYTYYYLNFKDGKYAGVYSI
ncbi:MAG: DUF5590 domain-containing protein [Ectobacillus sp.]